MHEQRTQSIDRGVRIAGSMILLALSLTGDMLNPATRILAACIGLYGLATGLCNYCPLEDLILRERAFRRNGPEAGARAVISAYAASAFFTGWTRPELNRLALSAGIEHYAAGQCIIRAGAPVICWHIIITGEVEQIFGNGTRPGTAAVCLTPGDCFGEESFMQASPALYTVRACTDVRTVELNAENMRTLLADAPGLGARLLSTALAANAKQMNTLLRTLL